MSVVVPERGAGGASPSPLAASGAPLGDLDVPGCDFDGRDRESPELLPLPGDPWLRRRMYGFGASELAALLIALGWRQPEAFGHYSRRAAKRLLRRKARLSKPLKRSEQADLGNEREARLIATWRRQLFDGTAGPHADLILPESVVYVEGFPPAARCLSPVVDRECPMLAASVDVLAYDAFGRLGVVNGKCSFDPYESLEPERAAQREADHHVQLHGEMAATGAQWGVIVEGVRWSNTWWDDKHGAQPVRTLPVVERNEALIEELRAAAREGWARVQQLMEGVSK